MRGPGEAGRRRVFASLLPALEVLLVTVAAHTAVGGSLPSLPWLASVAGLIALATGSVVGGTVSMRLMVPVLTAAQVALHLALTGMPASGDGYAAHAGHAMPAATGASASWDLSWRMVVAHLLSAALTALVWRVRRRAVEAVLGLDGVGPDPQPGTTTELAVRTDARGFRSLPWLSGDPGRAPPLANGTA